MSEATATKTEITVSTRINAPIDAVWKIWSDPKHITQWCAASEDWHAPYAENDLRDGGKFKTCMAAKDGSFSFDFEGLYTRVEENKTIAYTLGDDRTVQIDFEEEDGVTTVTEVFDAENTHPVEMQKTGWQAILDNFKKHVESNIGS